MSDNVIRYIFSADGKYILGGMMVGDTNDYVKLLALVKKKVHIFLVLLMSLLTTQCRKRSKFRHRNSW